MSTRVRTDFPVIVHDGALESHCRVVEASPVGLLLDRGREVTRRDERILLTLELHLPERLRSMFLLVRPVRSSGTLQAMHIVEMADTDRLNLAEHVDLQVARGLPAT